MTDFEDHLWSHLVEHGADRVSAHRPDSTRRRRRPLVLSGSATGLAAVAAGVALALTGTSATPAYAVTDNHNGTVTLMISQFADRADRAAVNRKLAQLGVRARVVPLQQSCPAALNMAWRYLQPSTQPWSTGPSVQSGPVGGWTVGIIPSRIPAGHTLVFAPRLLSNGWEMSDAIVDGRGPNCSSPAYTESLTH